MADESLGKTLRSLRMAADLSQEELATRAQVSRGSIQNWERDRSEPRRAEFRRLATALGISVADLRARSGGEQPTSVPGVEELADEVQTLRAELAEMRAALAAYEEDRPRDNPQPKQEREISG